MDDAEGATADLTTPPHAGRANAAAPLAGPDDRAATIRLLLASSLMLFLELALIRWLGANVVHLSYFSNFILLGSFLGIGTGFLVSRKGWSVWPLSLPLLTLLVIGGADLPGHHPAQRRRPDLFHIAPDERSACLAGAAGGLRAGGNDPRRARRGGRALLRQAAAAFGLSLRPVGIAGGYRRLCGAQLSARAIGRLGADRGRALSAARRPGAPARDDRMGIAAPARADARDDGAGSELVTLLQGDDRGDRRQGRGVPADQGKRRPASADGAGEVEDRAGRADLRDALPPAARQPARRRADRRGGIGLGRRDRASRGSESMRSISIRGSSRSAPHATSTGPMPTRA
ncbi:MAG: hypothetical protein WDN44_04665 [Sphingomonas sp.]